jgi:predicted nuclease of predicted toxin-antitoxin system
VAQLKFLVLTDENMENAISEQLKKRGIDASRAIDVLPVGTKDDELLEYAFQHGYSIVTYDKNIASHIDSRLDAGKKYAGVFIATEKLQGGKGVGLIIDFIADYDALIKGGAASVEDDVYNRTIYIS